jgi:hypothetical protein
MKRHRKRTIGTSRWKGTGTKVNRRNTTKTKDAWERLLLKKGQRKFNIKTAKTSTKLDHLQIGPFTIKKRLNFIITATDEDLSSIPYFVITAYQNPETNEDIEGS